MWNLRKYSNNVAAISEDNSEISYKDLSDYSDILGNKVDSKSLVFCLCNNSVGSLIGYVSFLLNKNVQVLLDSRQNNDYLKELINHYEPEFLWLPDNLFPTLNMGKTVYKAHGFVLLRINLCTKYELNNNLAILLPTSGTTGSSKMVMLSFVNLENNTKSIIKYLGISHDDKTITSLPMYYSYGLSVINTHLMAGGLIVFTEFSILQKQFWDKVNNYELTSLSGVPYTFELLDKLKFFEMDLPKLKTLCQAGGRLTNDLQKKIAKKSFELGKYFFVMYGATEASPRIAYLHYSMALDKIGSIGKVIPGGKIYLIDEDGKRISSSGIVGEIVYYGLNVAMGYAENGMDLIKPDEWEGVLSTGDYAKMDIDGYLYIVGRKNRFIKLFGIRINLDEIEQRLNEKFNNEMACIGSDNKIDIFLSNELISDEISIFLRQVWNFQPKYFQIHCIDAIPKSSVGKIDYSALKSIVGNIE